MTDFFSALGNQAMESNFKNVKPVADFLISLLETQKGDMMSNLKLQKLCYLAQGWSLARFDKPVFDNSIQAWALGPVVVDLYHELKHKSEMPITSADITTDAEKILSKEEKDFLKSIWKHYGFASSSQLVDLTHTHTPWIEAYQPDKGARHKRCDVVISIESMKKFFKKLDNKE